MSILTKQKVFLSFIAALVLSSIQIFAQANPIKFVQDSLPNGLQIIYTVDKSAPVVAVVMHYRVGSRDESPGLTGYAHFFEHLMFEATDNIPRAIIDKYVEEAGGDLNAHTSFDETVYYIKVPSNEVKLALWIESQRLRKLHVDSIGVETQRGVVLEEMKMRRENSPYGDFFDKAFENLFQKGSYSWTTLGSAEDIRNAKISDFKKFYDNFYQPCNATLVISGDFDIEETHQWVKEYFGIYPKVNQPLRNTIKITPLTKEIRQEVIDEKAQLPALFLCYIGPKLSDPDYYALTLLNDIIASGESSRFYRRLVDKEQVAVQAASFPVSLEHTGAIILYGIASAGKSLSKIEDEINDELDNIIENGVTEEELAKAKNIKETEFAASGKNVHDKAATLARYYSYYKDASMINNEMKKYLAVSVSDIKAAAKKYFGTKNRVVLEYLPKK